MLLVDQSPVVLNERLSSFSCDLVHLHLPDVQDTDVVQPFAAVEAAEDEKLLRSDHASCVSLSADRSFIDFVRVAPSHRLCVQNIKVIRRDDFL